jgi:predicted kinase
LSWTAGRAARACSVSAVAGSSDLVVSAFGTGMLEAVSIPPVRVPEVVVMVGLQGSGKTTWVARHLAGTHEVVSKDHWPNARHRERRQRRVLDELLAEGKDVVIDNTNLSPANRAPIIAIARAHGATVRAVYLDVPLHICAARNEARQGRARVPLVGVLAAFERLVPPSTEEGFDRVDTFTTEW